MGVSEKALATGNEVLELIPQRPPIVMVDALLSVDGKRSHTSLTVQETNMFCENGCLNESGLIEHMAQSAAARVGYLCKQENKPVPIGFIGALKNVQIAELPPVGAVLHTTITIEQEVMDITLISANTTVDGCLVMSGEMKIFIKPD